MPNSTVKLRGGEKSVAAYLKELPRPQRDIAKALHALTMRTVPDAVVQIKWGSPWYELDGENLAYITGVAGRINFGFPRGAELDSELLEGTGKGMRHIKVHSLVMVQPRKFATLLRQAAKLITGEPEKPVKSVTASKAKKPAVKVALARVGRASRWSFEQTMTALERAGTLQNVKTYKRHGMPEPLFGVSFANLSKIQKQIKVDHALAKKLWASKNADARNLAVKIADPTLFTEKELDAWVKGQNWYGSCDMLAGLIGKTKFAQAKAEKWIQSKDEWLGRTGWNLIGGLALDPKCELPESYFETMLEKLEQEIHGAKNYTRHAMNMTLICIGARTEKLRNLAFAASKRIGKVHVDHGDTDCKTPEAIPYIEKMWARKKK